VTEKLSEYEKSLTGKQTEEYKLLKSMVQASGHHTLYRVMDKALSKARSRAAKDRLLGINDRLVLTLGLPEQEHRHTTHR